MRNIQKEIQENLDEIEEKYHVKVLLAVESGSRAWGFASPDSDYDVRFIYVHDEGEYLRIDAMKEVIEWQLDEVLDINGWDLKKALLALGKGNPNIVEWANSPIVYRKADGWDQIWAVARTYFSEKAALCHYYGTANSTYQGYLTGDRIRYKKYFYALRPLLCCRYIERYHAIPPMEFEELLTMFDGKEEDLSEKLLLAIRDLLVRKTVTEEKDLNPQIPMIIDFIRTEIPRQKLLAERTPDDHRRDFTELNQVFRGICTGRLPLKFGALPIPRELEMCDCNSFTGVRLDTTGAGGYCVRENPGDPETTVMQHMHVGFAPGMKQDMHFHGFGKHLCVENYDIEITIFPGLRWIFKDENGNEDGYFEYTGSLNISRFNIHLGNRLLQVEHDFADGCDVLEGRERVARIKCIEKEQRHRFEEDGFDMETRTHFMISKDLDEDLYLYIMAIPVIGW